MYPEEAKNVALDIRLKLLGELALQHRASAQHPSQHPKPKPDAVGVSSSSDPPSSGDDSQANKARHGLILLPIKCSCAAHAYNPSRGSSPSPIPDSNAGELRVGPAGSESGVHGSPSPSRFAGDRGPIPVQVPIGGSVPCQWGRPQLSA
jgi:hypothetical protein